jgi:hypothetical protein
LGTWAQPADQREHRSKGGGLQIFDMETAPMRSVVLIHGVLRGMGREADCDMVAMKESQPDSRSPVYTRCSVLSAPHDLPDGRYSVYFEDRSVAVRRDQGLWLVEEPPIPSAA